jgi:hypothetical protein
MSVSQYPSDPPSFPPPAPPIPQEAFGGLLGQLARDIEWLKKDREQDNERLYRITRETASMKRMLTTVANQVLAIHQKVFPLTAWKQAVLLVIGSFAGGASATLAYHLVTRWIG